MCDFISKFCPLYLQSMFRFPSHISPPLLLASGPRRMISHQLLAVSPNWFPTSAFASCQPGSLSGKAEDSSSGLWDSHDLIPQSFLWPHFPLLGVLLITLTSLQARHSPAPGLWHHPLPRFLTLFSRYLPLLHLRYSDVSFSVWLSLTTLLIIVASPIPSTFPSIVLCALFFMVACIVTWPTACILLVCLPSRAWESWRQAFSVMLIPLNPAHSRCPATVCCMNIPFSVPLSSLCAFCLTGVIGVVFGSIHLFCVIMLSGAFETPPHLCIVWSPCSLKLVVVSS